MSQFSDHHDQGDESAKQQGSFLSDQPWSDDDKLSEFLEPLIEQFLIRALSLCMDMERMARMNVLPENEEAAKVLVPMFTYLRKVDMLSEAQYDRICRLYDQYHFSLSDHVSHPSWDNNSAESFIRRFES
jgi:ArsR family metal-binding transcriptional regulator